MKLSVIIPVYNEIGTLETILAKIEEVPVEKEIVIVDDGSSDGTRELLAKYERRPGYRIIYHPVNRGKGAAIRSAIGTATGDVLIIQDADLEYDPMDYLKLLKRYHPEERPVVYGSRFLNSENKHSYHSYYLGGRLVTFIANILFGLNLTDEPTCYKLFDSKLLKNIELKCERFEFCPEVTAKVARRGIKISEVPIHYFPRKITEGKKLRWTDGVAAVWTLLKYRVVK